MHRKLLLFSGRRHQFCRIQFEDAFTYQKLKEGSQGGELSSDRGLLFLFGMKARQPFTNRQMINLTDRRLGSLLFVFFFRRQVIEELLQVTLVIAQRVHAHVTLVTKMVEELSKQLIQCTRHESINWGSGQSGMKISIRTF